MKKHIPAQADRIRQQHSRRHRWYRLVLGLSCIVVFCTVYALIIPALTMEKTPICGLEEHTHNDDCYSLSLRYSGLDCAFAVHEHSDRCYDEDGTLICGEADTVIHSHDDLCYDENGELICPLPEVEEHRHDESCYKITEYSCGEKEREGHLHNEDCYAADGTLLCDREEREGHHHTAACKVEDKELICDKPEVIFHEHTAACFADGDTSTTPICGQLQTLRHQHDENCFKDASEEKVLTCTIPEHQHDDVLCYPAADESAEEMYHCGMAAHSHDDDCYDENGELICTVPEHQHDAACLEPAAPEDAKENTNENSKENTENKDGRETAGDAKGDSDKEEAAADDVRSLCLADENGTEITVKGRFPEDVTLSALDYDKEDLYELRQQLPLKEEKLLLAWDISLLQDGKAYQPTSPVEITLSSDALPKDTEELCGYALPTSAAALSNAETETEAAPLTLTADKKEVSFSTESFPLFYFTTPNPAPENDGEIVGEMGDSNSMQELAESGYFEYWEKVMAESKQAKANVQKSTAKAAANEGTPPSDQQVEKRGGEESSDGVKVSKTIKGTELENVFDITLKVQTKTNASEFFKEPDMAVMIVLDVSNTMTSDFGGIQREEAAIESAEYFIDNFAANTSGVSKVGLVLFNTDAHDAIHLRTCTKGAEATSFKNDLRQSVKKIVEQNNYVNSHSRFTNIEAGLKMASDQLNSAKNENKYIIFLSDGFPTTYIESGYNGYDPYCSGGNKGSDGVFYDFVSKKYCDYGTSYSDKAAIRARQEAARIKNSGINIFSIGIDIGGQQIKTYVDQTINSYFSVVDRTSENYEIGAADSTGAYKNWLKDKIGSGYYYDSTNLNGLKEAYDKIFAEIKSTHEEAAEAMWIANDPIPISNEVQDVEFIGFYDKNNILRIPPASLVGTIDSNGVVDKNGDNTASFDLSKQTINWDLKKSGYTSVESGNETTYTYSLVYRVRLKNENKTEPAFEEGTVYPTNDKTTLTYRLIETKDGEKTVSDKKEIEFPIPSVRGYLADLQFNKLSHLDGKEDKPLSGAEFTLSHSEECSICHGDGTAVAIPAAVSESDTNGNVSFTNIPSGHTYILKESKTPEGYKTNNDSYTVIVAYDKLTIKDKDGKKIPTEGFSVINYAGYELPATGGSGTKLFTLGGLLLVAFALIGRYILRRRQERRLT